VAVRAWRPDDAPALVEAVQESVVELAAWMPWAHAGWSRDDADAWIDESLVAMKAGSRYEFAIVDQDDGVLGACGVNQLRPVQRFANVGYWVRSAAAGRGVAPAAVRLISEFAFDVVGMQRIEIVVQVGNARSERVAAKAGATREGVLRHRLRTRDVPVDAVMYSLIPRDLGRTG
jgi:RimJ/RimL family protein N-acetyltransferase